MARSRFGFTVANAGDLDADGHEGTLRLVDSNNNDHDYG